MRKKLLILSAIIFPIFIVAFSAGSLANYLLPSNYSNKKIFQSTDFKIAQENVSNLPSGTLVRSNDPRVYYIENGLKRWIDSPESFRTQGFHESQIITVSEQDLSKYPNGEPVTIFSIVILPSEVDILPDLSPFGAQNIQLSTKDGRKIIRFTATFWNQGPGLFELISGDASFNNGDDYLETSQHLVRADGTTRDKKVGTFLWHELHHHYHYSDFADYVLEPIRVFSDAIAPNAITQKTTFCLRDNKKVTLDAKDAQFTFCGKSRQGVTVGWSDIYSYTLPDQYIDVNDLPYGIYSLSFKVDPRHHFVENNQENNISTVIFELNAVKGILKIIASASPFSTPENKYTDGMLVGPQGSSDIFIINKNKKRLIRNQSVFTSYGFNASQIYRLSPSLIQSIPNESFVRQAGASTIFMLNDNGFKRQILNPDVLKSYAMTASLVTEVNATEFASFPETELIQLKGTNDVYSINSKKYLGTVESIATLGYDKNSIHIVNQIDFDSYVAKVIAKDLFVPWDIVFLPEGDLLVTERSGTIRRIGVHPVTITLPDVLHTGEGGLMGMALHPNFTENKFVYLYFTVRDNAQTNRVARFTLDGDRLIPNKTIIENIPSALYHDGGQLAFGPDGMLYITVGDAEEPNLAQDLNSMAGKTLRYTADGQIPADNPFGTAVWSYGHRNAQGITWDDRGRMWQTEHGRSGTLSGLDELNLIEKGKNYGWPVIQGTATRENMVTPIINSGESYTWAPAGIAYTKGSLFFAGLRGSALYQAKLGEGQSVVSLNRHLENTFGRLRAVVLGPDGFLYITTSNKDGRGTVKIGDDKIIRIHPDFLR